MPDRLRIGVVSECDLGDRTAGSGAPCRMARALEKHCGYVVKVGPIERPPLPLIRRILWKIERTLTGKSPIWKSTRACCRQMAAMLETELNAVNCDVLFCAQAGWVMALSETDLPIFNCADLTLELACSMGYPSARVRAGRALREARGITGRHVKRSIAHFVPSNWVADSFKNDYGVPAESISVVAWGANLDPADVPVREDVLSKPKSPHCRMLMLANTWHAKGGQIAFQTLLELERVGIEADLIVCGAVPPRNVAHKRLKIIPYLDKNEPAQRKRLMRLIGSSDFLILPTRRDTFGHVFCEANAYGVPAIATDVGGVAEVIRNGVNGYTLPLSAGPADYAELIRDIYLDDERYRRLVRGSRDEFEQRLNWDVWGRGVAEYMRKVLPAELAAKVGPA